MRERLLRFLLLLLLLPTGAAAAELHTTAALDEGPGNITLTPDGRIIVSLHQFFATDQRVAEILPNGSLMPFPNARWALGGATDYISLDTVLGIRADPAGVVWMLDNGKRGGSVPKLVAWDTRVDKLHKVIHLPPPVTPANAFINDLAVDTTHGSIYIADPAGGDNAALIVVDSKTGMARRVLQGHKSVIPEALDLIIDGKPVEVTRPDGTTFRPHVGVNPIALDANNEWLYFGPMHGTSLYRVRTADLLNNALPAAALASRVERYSDKPICDGIGMDNAGNIYVSDVGNNAVGLIDSDRQYRILFQDERLSWPDAFSFGPDGNVYVVANQLQRTAALNAGKDLTHPPFYVLHFKPLAPGVIGR